MACPLGAHYLPLPGPDAPEVAELLRRARPAARTKPAARSYDERHLCHSPQERLFIDGALARGPAAAGRSRASARARRSTALRASASRDVAARAALRDADARARRGRRAMPRSTRIDLRAVARRAAASTTPALRWYLDYCCRDDYGAGSDVVSAWAGLHYFASRHGFHAPRRRRRQSATRCSPGPKAMPGWRERLAAPLRRAPARRPRRRCASTRGATTSTVDAWNARDGSARALDRAAGRAGGAAVRRGAHARVAAAGAARGRRAALRTRRGWSPTCTCASRCSTAAARRRRGTTCVYGSAALGYVDAMHQSLRPHPGPTVLTAYWALGGAAAEALRTARGCSNEPWRRGRARGRRPRPRAPRPAAQAAAQSISCATAMRWRSRRRACAAARRCAALAGPRPAACTSRTATWPATRCSRRRYTTARAPAGPRRRCAGGRLPSA